MQCIGHKFICGASAGRHRLGPVKSVSVFESIHLDVKRANRRSGRSKSGEGFVTGSKLLDEIVRQKDPMLESVIEQLARGDVREAIQNLDR